MNPPTTGSKRKISIAVHPVPIYDDNKKFAKFLNGLDITYAKSKKITGMVSANITFETEEQQEDAKKKLKGYELNGNVLQIRDINEAAQKQRAEVKRANNPVPLAECIEDVVTPWHKVPYEKQIEDKSKEMEDILKKITYSVYKASAHSPIAWTKEKRGLMCCPFEGVKESPLKEGYRNKVELSFGYSKEGKPTVGFLLGKIKDGHVAVANSENCKNVSEKAKKIVALFQELVDETEPKFKVWKKEELVGFYRLLTVKTTDFNQSMVTLQVNPTALSEEDKQEFNKILISKIENSKLVDSLYIQYYSNMSNAAPFDCPVYHLWGLTHIHEKLFDLKFRISPSSFFQTNTKATEILYSLIREWAGEISSETTVLDVCCGTGTIGITLSDSVQKMIGIEMVDCAIEDANFNASLNNREKVCTFVVGKAEDVLKEIISSEKLYLKKHGEVVAVVDPPRSGLHNKAIKAIRECESITRLIYVSCNPLSLVDNSAALCKGTSNYVTGTPFVPVKATAVDLFPHTPHCELVMLFEREIKPKTTNETTEKAENEKTQ